MSGTEDRPAAAPPAWDDNADDVLLEGMATALLALVVLAIVRSLASWLWSRREDPDEERDEDGNSDSTNKQDIHAHMASAVRMGLPDRSPDAGPSSAIGMGMADAQARRRPDPERCRPRNARDAQDWAMKYSEGFRMGDGE